MIFFLLFLFCLMPSFQHILFSNCSSRFLRKLEGVELNIMVSFRQNISGKEKLLQPFTYSVLFNPYNILQCRHHYIYLPDEETGVQ